MSLLSQLALAMDRLSGELVATEALGLLLTNESAAGLMTTALRSVDPGLPGSLRYSTQAGGEGGRPDVVGRDGQREVVHVEGKFWAGLTEAQAKGHYLNRLRRQHESQQARGRHVGTLVFVVPPRRVGALMEELSRLYALEDVTVSGAWRVGRHRGDMTVAVVDWETLLEVFADAQEQEVAEDGRQLLDLVRQVDYRGFVPWTDEQRTDQETPRRLLRLAGLVDAVHSHVLASGVAQTSGRRQTITSGGSLAYGKRMQIGGVTATLRLSLRLWEAHGRSPLWLTFGNGSASVVRQALPDEMIVEHLRRGGVAMPLDLPTSKVESQVVSDLVSSLRGIAEKLSSHSAGLSLDDDDEEADL